MKNEVALARNLHDMIAEYDEKVENIPTSIKTFNQACDDLKMSSLVGGTFGGTSIDTGRGVIEREMKLSLKQSAWKHLFNYLNLDYIASAKDKKLFEQTMTDPPEFNIDNIRASFGKYVSDPMSNILRGLAEIFCELDQSFKSHDKVKIGVDGLPKRVILGGFGEYCYYGRERLRDILNALAAYQGYALVSHGDVNKWVDTARKNKGQAIEIIDPETDEKPGLDRGLALKIFKNGNAHLIFSQSTLRDINKALADYYGEVLCDAYTEKPEERQMSTEISKDLQYYPTPVHVVKRVLDDVYIREGVKVLEPSCGCGRFMDAIADLGADVFGVEVDSSRVDECRAKGHKVYQGNFLEMVPQPIYDYVVMNPPFYGKHYVKHVKHALNFLKEDGMLVTLLPVTARYDHKLLDGVWRDLPVGSFRESGTNINTTILKMRKQR